MQAIILYTKIKCNGEGAMSSQTPTEGILIRVSISNKVIFSGGNKLFL